MTWPPDEVLETDLTTVDLADAPPYEALSYAWGDPFDTRGALLIDECGVGIHGVLFMTLCALRSTTSELLLCAGDTYIDQTNVKEKNSQVSLMAEVYVKASNVFIYLGPATERTEEGMRALRWFTDLNAAPEDALWL